MGESEDAVLAVVAPNTGGADASEGSAFSDGMKSAVVEGHATGECFLLDALLLVGVLCKWVESQESKSPLSALFTLSQ